MAPYRGPEGLQPYGTRSQILRIPPDSAPSPSNRWTALYLVSGPLPAHVSVIQFDIISHDQGWCTNPQKGAWSWFEVSILGSWQENANPDFHTLSDATYLRECPEDFGQTFDEEGLYFKDIPQDGSDGSGTGPSAISVPVARNTIRRHWQHQTITWTETDNYGDGSGFLSLLEEGDRLAIWARAKFPGWMNYVKEIRVMISTHAMQQTPERLHDSTPATQTAQEQTERISRQGSIGPVGNVAQTQTVLISDDADVPDDKDKVVTMDDLDEAIRVSRLSLEALPDDPDLATRLGWDLHSRYYRTGQMNDLEEAIQIGRRVLKAAPDDNPKLADCFAMLGFVLRTRYDCKGQMCDLEEAIRMYRQAVHNVPDDHPHLPSWLSVFSFALQAQFERVGQLCDLEEAIRMYRQAIHNLPDDHSTLHALLTGLGIAFLIRYECLGQMDDLEEAIRLSHQAVKATPNDRLDMARLLCHIGTTLIRRYERTGQIDDLEEAIKTYRQAVEGASDNMSDLSYSLSNLAFALQTRYMHKGQTGDLEEAIQVCRQTIKATPNDHPDLAGYLNNLGIMLQTRFNRTGNLNDLEEATRMSRQVVAHTYQPLSQRPLLSQLGISAHTSI